MNEWIINEIELAFKNREKKRRYENNKNKHSY